MELEVPLAESGGKLQRREPEEERAGQNVNERQGHMPSKPSIQTGTDTSVAGETDLDTDIEVPISPQSTQRTTKEFPCAPVVKMSCGTI